MMTYARVAHDAAPGTMAARPHDSGVDAFLFDHVSSLLERAKRGDSPIANFIEPDAARLFEQLRKGTADEFLVATPGVPTVDPRRGRPLTHTGPRDRHRSAPRARRGYATGLWRRAGRHRLE